MPWKRVTKNGNRMGVASTLGMVAACLDGKGESARAKWTYHFMTAEDARAFADALLRAAEITDSLKEGR